MQQLINLKNPFNAPIYHEETVSTTFDVARNLAESNAPSGTVISADFQNTGRGSRNRPWSAARGKNLLFTVLLRYDDVQSIPKAITLRTGLAVSLAIEDFAPALQGRTRLKWVNDVMIVPAMTADNSAPLQTPFKTAGILTESDGKCVFIGIGVNVLQQDFPEDFRNKAGSLIHVVPSLSENARFTLLERILSRLYAEGLSRDSTPSSIYTAPWQERLEQRLYKKGEQVIFAPNADDSRTVVEGTLAGIGNAGELRIIPNGEMAELTFAAGELRVYGRNQC